MSGRELAGFFDLVERVGCVRLPATTLTNRVSFAALSALRAERVLEDATPAEALPCPHREDCAREVKDTWEDKPRVRDVGRRYLTVCGHRPPECESVWLADDDVRTMVIRLAQLFRLVTDRFAIDRLADLPTSWGAPSEPRLIGTQSIGTFEGATRDVFLALRPPSELSASWLTMRESSSRTSIVLVPTLRRIAFDHGPMGKVQIVALEDALAIHTDGIVVSASGAGLRMVKPAKPANDLGAPVAPRKKRVSRPKPRKR